MREPGSIETRQLSRRFGRRHAVHGLDLVVEGPGVVGLVGPNGAGKTTTMRILAGLLAPSGGRAIVCGHDVALAPRPVAARVGWAPEEPPLNACLTVREQLDAAAALRGADRARVDDLVRRLGLGTRERRLTGTLSRGERHRVGLAQALVGDPSVVLLDEPGAGLDPSGLRELGALIRELAADRVVLLSTHRLDEAERICDRVVLLRDGRALGEGTVEDLARGAGLSPWLEVRLGDDVDVDVADALAALPGVARVRRLERGYHVEGPAGLAADVAAVAAREGWRLEALTPRRPSLDDVYRARVEGAA